MLKCGHYDSHLSIARPTLLRSKNSHVGILAHASKASSGPILPTIIDIREGKGSVLKPGSVVRCHYEGRLRDKEGEAVVFDSSRGKSPFVFVLGEGQVIQGWDIGLLSMREGGLRRLLIPSDLAYGNRGIRDPVDKTRYIVPPNAELEFEIELLFTDSPIFTIQWKAQKMLEKAGWWLGELVRGPG